MTDIRAFIRNLGDKAPEFFDTKPATVQRWLKTGSVPMKMVQKILLALQGAATPAAEPEFETKGVAEVPPQPEIDPVTHLPTNLDRKLPAIQGHPPDVIETNPLEQSVGVNFTRPGRGPTPLPPMRIRKDGGQDVAYVPNQPPPPTVIPPTMDQSASWSKPMEVKKPDGDKPKS